MSSPFSDGIAGELVAAAPVFLVLEASWLAAVGSVAVSEVCLMEGQGSAAAAAVVVVCSR
jgi:hypothetical protein